MAKHKIKLTSLDTVEIDTTPQEENKLTAIMAEMAEEARELLEEAKEDEDCFELQRAWAKEDMAMTINYYYNRMREVLENE